MGISRLTVAASSVASATVATVKPGLQEVSQRYQRGELAESASTLLATGADLGLKGLTNLKGLLKTAVSQIDSYAGAAALGGDGDHAGGRPPAYAPQMSSYQSGPAPAAGGGGWNGWDDGRTGGREDDGDWRGAAAQQPQQQLQQQPKAQDKKAQKWAGWDAGDELPDEVWDADWGK